MERYRKSFKRESSSALLWLVFIVTNFRYESKRDQFSHRPPTELVTEGIGRLHEASDANSAAAGKEQSQYSRPRPILARFVSRMDTDAVWERKRGIHKSRSPSSVFIDKELSVEWVIIQGKLRAPYRIAKNLTITRVSIKGNKLFVNGNSYSAGKLPDYLTLTAGGYNGNQHTSTSPE